MPSDSLTPSSPFRPSSTPATTTIGVSSSPNFAPVYRFIIGSIGEPSLPLLDLLEMKALLVLRHSLQENVAIPIKQPSWHKGEVAVPQQPRERRNLYDKAMH